MPTYVYECSSCNQQFEVEQRITENALDTCQCGSNGTVKRIIQPIAVMFKGSGFHINDYASSTSGSAGSSSSKEPEATETPKPESTTTESAPATPVATPPSPTS
ncbi:MAG: zinc ribbon domain-containing protein [Fimbriimonas sp.]|nr:zinc ribbon domain-containing protein [Fimbriimonas sp.]